MSAVADRGVPVDEALAGREITALLPAARVGVGDRYGRTCR